MNIDRFYPERKAMGKTHGKIINLTDPYLSGLDNEKEEISKRVFSLSDQDIVDAVNRLRAQDNTANDGSLRVSTVLSAQVSEGYIHTHFCGLLSQLRGKGREEVYIACFDDGFAATQLLNRVVSIQGMLSRPRNEAIPIPAKANYSLGFRLFSRNDPGGWFNRISDIDRYYRS